MKAGSSSGGAGCRHPALLASAKGQHGYAPLPGQQGQPSVPEGGETLGKSQSTGHSCAGAAVAGRLRHPPALRCSPCSCGEGGSKRVRGPRAGGAEPRAVPARPRGALGAAGSARTRPALLAPSAAGRDRALRAAAAREGAGSPGETCKRSGDAPAASGGGGCWGGAGPPAAALGEAPGAVPRPCGAAGAVRPARCPTGAPVRLSRSRSCRCWVLLPFLPLPLQDRRGAGQGACARNTLPRGEKRFPFRHPPKQPAGDGVWLSGPW